MKILVTGATGFVGRHVVTQLLECGHFVIATARDIERAKVMPWYSQVEFVPCDLQQDFQPLLQNTPLPDAIVHLAWPGLPNYRDFFHIDRNLPADIAFLKAAIEAGVSQLMVAGTCLEYGMQYGPLSEEMVTHPTTPYGFAKDALRKALQLLQKNHSFTLQWMRLFYMYGEGQNKNSLLAQLDRAIDEGQPVFNMSAGDQLRDYLPVEKVAENFVRVLEASVCHGVINCCSGVPISVRELVEQRCKEKEAIIELNRGYYPYPDYEPLAFWGEAKKLANIV